MLTLNNIEVTYSNVILVLRGVSLQVPAGRIVALLGANGAGKTTLLNAVSGLLQRMNGRVTSGTVAFDGQRIDGLAPEAIVRRGLVQVLESRRMFRQLSVEENLLTGALFRPQRAAREDIKRVYEYFPRLWDLRKRTSGYLSGGEQQMLVIGRGLMARPKLMLLDEPSIGLAPLMVEEIFRVIRQINAEEGMSLLLVEQNARVALDAADYAYVLETGRIVLHGPVDQLRENANIKEFYLGMNAEGERKSYREVKHYKRRKRWIG